MAGNIVCLIDEIGGTDLILPKAEMGYGDTAGFLGVVGEIALSIEIGLITDNLNGALVGTNGSVGSKAPELATDGAGILGNNPLVHRKRQIGYIVYDTNGKSIPGIIKLKVLEHTENLAWGGVL